MILGLLTLLYGQGWFINIGWRVLFAIGVIIAIIGVYIRLRISESLVFRFAKSRGNIPKLPLIDAFREGYWKRIIHDLGFIIGGTTMTYVTSVFAFTYLTSILHVPLLEVTIT